MEERARVLIIDDDLLVARTIQRCLLPHDVEIETDSVRAANRLADGERFDLVLCDFYMPRMNGGDVLAVVTAAAPDILPGFVFVTAGGGTAAHRAIIASAPGGVILKPFDAGDLRRLAAHAVARRESRRERPDGE